MRRIDYLDPEPPDEMSPEDYLETIHTLFGNPGDPWPRAAAYFDVGKSTLQQYAYRGPYWKPVPVAYNLALRHLLAERERRRQRLPAGTQPT